MFKVPPLRVWVQCPLLDLVPRFTTQASHSRDHCKAVASRTMKPTWDTHGFGPVPTRRLRGYGAEHPWGGASSVYESLDGAPPPT